jgi:hypothetical protein
MMVLLQRTQESHNRFGKEQYKELLRARDASTLKGQVAITGNHDKKGASLAAMKEEERVGKSGNRELERMIAEVLEVLETGDLEGVKDMLWTLVPRTGQEQKMRPAQKEHGKMEEEADCLLSERGP